jgi:transcriptional regulator with XRE-family HTH domain
MLHCQQVRAARALLQWRQEDLAAASGVGSATIRRIEARNGPLAGTVATMRRLQAAFEKAGIEFLEDGDGLGVKMRYK